MESLRLADYNIDVFGNRGDSGFSIYGEPLSSVEVQVCEVRVWAKAKDLAVIFVKSDSWSSFGTTGNCPGNIFGRIQYVRFCRILKHHQVLARANNAGCKITSAIKCRCTVLNSLFC
jgi:hypothetical protein